MSDPSRRDAAARELTRRNREAEAARLEHFDSIEWGNAAGLSDWIKRNTIRLGGKLRPQESTRAMDCLVHGIEWPRGEFRSSVTLFQQHMARLGVEGFENASEYELEDSLPFRTIDFQFLPLESSGSFWEGWESEFEAVDPSAMIPFGSDGHYFLFIADNPEDPSDPLLLTVDHEEVSEEPYHPEATVGDFLATLEWAAESSDE